MRRPVASSGQMVWVDVSTEVGNVGGKGAFVGELSERDLSSDYSIGTAEGVKSWKVIKVPEGAASEVQVRRVHIKKKSSSRRSGCRGEAQDAQSSGP